MNVSGLSFFTTSKERSYEDENHLGNGLFHSEINLKRLIRRYRL